MSLQAQMAAALCDFVADEGERCEECGKAMPRGDHVWWIADGYPSCDGTYIGKCCLAVFSPQQQADRS